MESNRPYFTFLRSFYEAIEQCPEGVQLELYRAIALYGLNMIEPKEKDMSQQARPLWSLIKPLLYKQWVNYENGRQGGAPEGNSNARKRKNNRKTTEKQPTPSEEKDKDKDKDNTPNGVIFIAPQSLSDRQKDFRNELAPYASIYPADVLRSFYDYWSEPNRTKSKMRLELEKTWDTARRLARWHQRSERVSPADNIATAQAEQLRNVAETII